ncbi:hypothetical protein MUY27_19910 [Mucilaginibacter sp. RS28]|uniref:Uncharacterized protein n=1 Tax=Mucilaginibacter straminoryzae TaxID=2932774 RepID=A0A9X2BAL5_9SPHI|nr:hypothetical protein [Mucilaginibacter straminoryzae]MCJ8211994.1 hypothetical protein [Mucilaginibacter straminoryzae]
MTKSFVLEKNMTIVSKAHITGAVVNLIERTVEAYNYKVIDKTERSVLFEPYGTQPVTRSNSAYYLQCGVFNLLNNANVLTVQLKYSISFWGEFLLFVLMIVGVLLVGYPVFLFSIIIFISISKRLKRIKTQAQEMLLDITNKVEYLDSKL